MFSGEELMRLVVEKKKKHCSLELYKNKTSTKN